MRAFLNWNSLPDLPPSPKKERKKNTITFQGYELEEMRQKYSLNMYKCKSAIEFPLPVSECNFRRSVDSATSFLSDEIPLCTLWLETGFHFEWPT